MMRLKRELGSRAATRAPQCPASPTFIFVARMAAISFSGSSVASRWKMKELAPAAAKGSTHCSGLDTIRWQSYGKHGKVV